MAKTRTSQAAGVRFAPVAKVVVMCVALTGSAVGYVWQKGEIDDLGRQEHQREARLAQLQRSNQRLTDAIAILHSPIELDQRVKELNLGLGPQAPGQVVQLPEPALAPGGVKPGIRQLAERQDD